VWLVHVEATWFRRSRVRPSYLPIDGHDGARSRSIGQDLEQPVVQARERVDAATAVEQVLSVAMLSCFGVGRTADEAVDGLLRAAQQGKFDELGANVVAETVQREHEFQATEELGDHDFATSRQLHARHLQRDAPCDEAGFGGLIEPAPEHRANGVDVEG